MKVPILSRLRSLSSIDRHVDDKDNDDMKHGGSLDYASAPNSPTANKNQQSGSNTSTSTTHAPPTPSGKDSVSKKSSKQYLQPTSSTNSLKSNKSSPSSGSSSVKNTPRMTPRQTPRQTPRGVIPEEGEGIESLGPISDSAEDEYKSGSFFSKFISNTFSGFSMDAAPETVISSRPPSRVTSPNIQSQSQSSTPRNQSRRPSRIDL